MLAHSKHLVDDVIIINIFYYIIDNIIINI